MAVFKCKMCGGTLEFDAGATVGTCDSCGTTQTLPSGNDEMIRNLHNRANTLRLKCEFDRAEELYHKILEKNNEDSEAHWGVILCKYGIEYVEDPVTYRRVPTCHRASFEAVLSDEDYKAALACGDAAQRRIYEEQAREIDAIQRDILAIAENEKPFDVFICYKETDFEGNRTIDSVIAGDMYQHLTQEGFKVFFAAITLEDKLGTAYEPYIFAALHSAKVMLAVGSRPEFFTAVWVKNEWSRFLKLMRTDRRKLLIPCYKDMDAYELPDEFAHLQAQDMNKIGFMQDLIRGIRKVVAPAVAQPAPGGYAQPVGNTSTLLKRAALFVEEGAWDNALEYCEKIFDVDPECAQAYLQKLLATLKLHEEQALASCRQPFEEMADYARILRFGDEALSLRMKAYVAKRQAMIKEECAQLLEKAYAQMDAYKTEEARALLMEILALDKNHAPAYVGLLLLELCRKRPRDLAFEGRPFEHMDNYKEAIRCADEALRKELESYAEQARSRHERMVDQCYLAFENKLRDITICHHTPLLEKARQSQRLMEQVCDSREELTAELRQLMQKQEEQEELLSRLEVSRNNLGLFAIGRKKELDKKIPELYQAIHDGEKRIAALSEKLCGCKTKEEFEQKKAEIDRQIATMEKELGDFRTENSTMLFSSAQQDVRNNRALRAEFCRRHNNLFWLMDSSFGYYPQEENGKDRTPIDWITLAVEEDRVLMISKYAIDHKRFHDSAEDVTWENCSLRRWLNQEFLHTAFAEKSIAKIVPVTVPAAHNKDTGARGGRDTTDRVFLLSMEEAQKYLSSERSRQCVPTPYAIKQGAGVSDAWKTKDKGNCWWWLRSPGKTQRQAAYVYDGGAIQKDGVNVEYNYYAVRPAIWVNILQ